MLLPLVRMQAQVDTLEAHRFVTQATLFGMGYTNVLDTYLSPQEYTGVEFRTSRETMRMTKLYDGNISAQHFFQAHVAYTGNKVDNNNTFSGLVNWNYALHYQFPLAHGFKLLAGAVGDFNGGFVYNLQNTNNPASAKGYVNLGASGMAIWHTRIRRTPVIFRYQLNVPLMGVMFSPHYGQSYYEIFTLGNTSGVLRFTSLHNQPSFRQMLTADVPVGATKIRFSYLCDIQQAEVNQLRTHTYSHIFMVGWVRNLYRYHGRKVADIPLHLRAY